MIDASVLLAASEKQHPISSSCRELLMLVLEICHRAVYTDLLRHEVEARPRERGKRPSAFAVRWLATMRSRRKLIVEPDRQHAGLRESVEALAVSEKVRTILEEDLYLIEAAICA